jgi:hypothetical protein
LALPGSKRATLNGSSSAIGSSSAGSSAAGSSAAGSSAAGSSAAGAAGWQALRNNIKINRAVPSIHSFLLMIYSFWFFSNICGKLGNLLRFWGQHKTGLWRVSLQKPTPRHIDEIYTLFTSFLYFLTTFIGDMVE